MYIYIFKDTYRKISILELNINKVYQELQELIFYKKIGFGAID